MIRTILRHKKILAVLVVVALVAIYFSTSISNGWKEGAPEATIVCNIKAAGDTLTGSTTIGGGTKTGQMVPLTSFSSNIDTLDAMTQYTISFGATMSTKTAKFGEALTNSISVTGKTGGSKANENYLDSTGAVSSSASVAGTAGGSSTLSIPGFVKHTYIPSDNVIMGDVIDGSVFTFTISSSAADGRVSTTTATLTITVDSGGKIYLSVDNIEVNLDDVVFYEGWDDVNHPEHIYIYITPSGVYRIEWNRADTGAFAAGNIAEKETMRTYLTDSYNLGRFTTRQYNCGIAQLDALP